MGDDLVGDLRTLLEKYTAEELHMKVQAMRIDTDLDDCGSLAEIIESGVGPYHTCDDIEYLYELDFEAQTLVGSHLCSGDRRTLSFSEILEGKVFDDFRLSYNEEDDIARHDADCGSSSDSSDGS